MTVVTIVPKTPSKSFSSWRSHIKLWSIQRLVLAVCVSRMAYVSVLTGLVVSCGASVYLLEFETPSGYICIMRNQAAIDPSVVITKVASDGYCVKKWGMLGHLLLATVALGGVPTVRDPIVGMPVSRAWRRAVEKGSFKIENNWIMNVELFAFWRQQREAGTMLRS